MFSAADNCSKIHSCLSESLSGYTSLVTDCQYEIITKGKGKGQTFVIVHPK